MTDTIKRGVVDSLNALLSGIIAAVNSLGTPWVAITVIILGMYFALQSNKAGLPSDIASGVIGAGVGLLTGQALRNHQQDFQQPGGPAQPK